MWLTDGVCGKTPPHFQQIRTVRMVIRSFIGLGQTKNKTLCYLLILTVSRLRKKGFRGLALTMPREAIKSILRLSGMSVQRKARCRVFSLRS